MSNKLYDIVVLRHSNHMCKIVGMWDDQLWLKTMVGHHFFTVKETAINNITDAERRKKEPAK